jgi:hypothetical protein
LLVRDVLHAALVVTVHRCKIAQDRLREEYNDMGEGGDMEEGVTH